MSFLDQLSAKVNQGFNQVTSQTKDFTEQVKIENEIKNLEKAAQANYEELGRAMYNASRHSSGEAADYEVIMRQIDGILQQIQEKKAAKQEIMKPGYLSLLRQECPRGHEVLQLLRGSDGADSGGRGSAGRAAGARRGTTDGRRADVRC